MNGSSIVANPNLLLNTPLDVSEVARHHMQTINHASGDMAQPKPKRSLYILCIDDDPHILELLNDCFTHYNHRVMVASGGKRGLEMFRAASLENQPYEVVITDLGMPDIDGQRVARAIKAESPKTPVIMMTGWGTFMEDDRETPLQVDAVVGKPTRMQELNDLVLRITAPAAPSP